MPVYMFTIQRARPERAFKMSRMFLSLLSFPAIGLPEVVGPSSSCYVPIRVPCGLRRAPLGNFRLTILDFSGGSVRCLCHGCSALAAIEDAE